jgi:hypothetical protein
LLALDVVDRGVGKGELLGAAGGVFGQDYEAAGPGEIALVGPAELFGGQEGCAFAVHAEDAAQNIVASELWRGGGCAQELANLNLDWAGCAKAGGAYVLVLCHDMAVAEDFLGGGGGVFEDDAHC